MPTEVLKIDDAGGHRDILRRAVDALRAGELVVFPTETVYGVGVCADSGAAVAALRKIKGRKANKPFTVHIAKPVDVERFVPRLSARARRFVRKAWPGPVTVVFPVDDPSAMPVIKDLGVENVQRLYHAQSIGIRCPADPIASELLAGVEVPVVAASANRAGALPPRSAAEAVAALDGQVTLVLDAGLTRYAKASTVVRLVGDGCEILREGVIDERSVRRYGSLNIVFVCSGNTCRSPMAAAMCRAALANRLNCAREALEDRGIFVRSAGASSFGGSPASEGAITAMNRRGLDLSQHSARALNAELIHQADHVFGMTRSHLDAVLSLVPSAVDRTQLIAVDQEIDDPYGGAGERYEACAVAIEEALDRRLQEILE